MAGGVSGEEEVPASRPFVRTSSGTVPVVGPAVPPECVAFVAEPPVVLLCRCCHGTTSFKCCSALTFRASQLGPSVIVDGRRMSQPCTVRAYLRRIAICLASSPEHVSNCCKLSPGLRLTPPGADSG